MPQRPVKWKPWVHPADRGYVLCPAGKAMREALARFGFTVEFAAPRGRQTAEVHWMPAEATETAELLSIINTAMKVSFNVSAVILTGLRGLPGWEETMGELRSCYRLGADTKTLRSIIEPLTKHPPDGGPTT
jgi:hypothetical protein